MSALPRNRTKERRSRALRFAPEQRPARDADRAGVFHHGAFEFWDNGEASRSLFDAVAEMSTLMPMVRELEARLAADARSASLDATEGPARS
jgi:hypothetical protein